MQNTSFSHSVKVPKLYKCAAKISQEVAGGNGSIKQLVYEKKHFNTKALYALVVTTFQKTKEIDLILKRTKLFEKEPRLDPWLAKILISEVIWGKKQLPKCDAKPIQTILAYEQAFHAHLSDSSGDTTAGKLEIRKKPRYVRINTIINPFNEALELFQDEGWTLQMPNVQSGYESFLEQVRNLEGDFMLKDLHIPDLLIFPAGTEFYNHPGYKKGALVLQDKASCLPVHLLSPPPGSVVLDMCAAPGMKTTQLATMLQNEGIIYAVERDPKRFEVLNKMVEASGATCIKTINKDVLQCGDADFHDVDYILVDPSCSASGMTDRLELQQNRDQQRLQKLAGFQIKILRSALTRYPKAKKVVYSTCSLYPEENEDVVRQVLETNNLFKLVRAGEFINKAWTNFGSPDFGDIGRYCLYAKPEKDLSNGFFVAVFERLEEGENNQFFNGRVLKYMKNVEQKQARKERKYREMMEEGDRFEVNEEKTGQQLPAINGNDVDGDGTMNKDPTYKYTNDHKKKNKNKRTTNVDTPSQDFEIKNADEFVGKQKKRKREHSGDAISLQTAKEDEEIANNDAVENDLPEESSKKSKKKKRKSKEECENIEQITGRDIEVAEDMVVGDTDRTDKDDPLVKAKKKNKKQKHTDFEQLYNENIDNPYNKTEESLKKDKKKHKHKKHSEENAEVDVILEDPVKKNKKMKAKTEDTSLRDDFKNINPDLGSVSNKSLKESKKKKTTDEKKSYKQNEDKKKLSDDNLRQYFENLGQDEDHIIKKNKKKKEK